MRDLPDVFGCCKLTGQTVGRGPNNDQTQPNYALQEAA